MAEKMPLIVSRFLNLLWVNLPANFEIKPVLNQNILFITILFSNNQRVRKLRRQYSLQKIESRKNDLFGMAEDCAEEIQSYFYKRRK